MTDSNYKRAIRGPEGVMTSLLAKSQFLKGAVGMVHFKKLTNCLIYSIHSPVKDVGNN